MNAARRELYKLFLGVLVWLPLFYVLWYFVIALLAGPVVWLSFQILDVLFPSVMRSLLPVNGELAFVTSLHEASEPMDSIALVTSPLKYLYGMPFFLALTAATRRPDRLTKMSLGLALLLPFALWGVVFEAMKSLCFDLGGLFLPLVEFSDWQIQAVAVGYQMGSLLFPVLAPLVIWGFLDKEHFIYLCGTGQNNPMARHREAGPGL